MVPGGVALWLVSQNLVLGLIALLVYILGFEFAVVSMLPLATHLVPKRPGSGLGLALIGAASAGIATLLIYSYHRRGGLVHE
jgi:hypothetical protein